VDTAEGPAQESGAASWGIRSLREPAGFTGACPLPLPFQQIILQLNKLQPHRSQSLLARQRSLLGQKASGGKDHRLTAGRGSVFVATKMAHRSLSTNPVFLMGNIRTQRAIRGTDQHYKVGACSFRGICG